MGQKTVITINHGSEASGTITELMSGTDASVTANKLLDFFGALAGGNRQANVEINMNAVQASKGVTVVTPAADDTVVVNGKTFTAKVAPANAAEFALGADDNATASNLAAIINASADSLIDGVASASVSVGGIAEVAQVTMIADDSQKQAATLTLPAVADLTQADYVVITNKAGDTEALWFDIDADGTAPTGAAYTAAGTKTKVSVTTGQTAIQVAAAFYAAVSLANVTKVDHLDGTVTLSQALVGVVAAPVPHNADDSGAGSVVVVADAPGHAASLQNKYFTFKSANNATSFYAWFNVNGEGVDPAPGGTGAAIAVTIGDNATTIGATAAVAISLLSGVSATSALGIVTIRSLNEGVQTDVGAGNSGLTVSVSSQGVDPVVLISAFKPGVTGNSITLSATGGFTAGGALLSGGTDGTTASVSFGQ